MGHLLCFPTFGPPTPTEIGHGFTFHGEALTVEWVQQQPPQISDEAITLSYGADLPAVQYRVERTVTLRANESVVQVEEWIENLAPFDRPFNRDQHPTFGPPFVEPGKTMLDLSGSKLLILPGRDAGGACRLARPFGLRPSNPMARRWICVLRKPHFFFAIGWVLAPSDQSTRPPAEQPRRQREWARARPPGFDRPPSVRSSPPPSSAQPGGPGKIGARRP